MTRCVFDLPCSRLLGLAPKAAVTGDLGHDSCICFFFSFSFGARTHADCIIMSVSPTMKAPNFKKEGAQKGGDGLFGLHSTSPESEVKHIQPVLLLHPSSVSVLEKICFRAATFSQLID